MMDLALYFKEAIDRRASDLHLVEGSVPTLRIAGELLRLGDEVIKEGELKEAVFQYLDTGTQERFINNRDVDLSMEFYEIHFRVNIHHQSGRVGLSARLVSDIIPTPSEINLEEAIYGLTHLRDGLVLLTGPAGVGKSTTLAVMIDVINKERSSHIITIEDPIEYTFHDNNSLVEQRQLGRDTHSFAEALKYVLRQDPNVIMVGEMRDKETVEAVMNAAKTGHLVLSTLHTSSASETVERIVDFYPAQFQNQIAHQLATVLRAVISQQLLPAKNGGMIAAREIMINDSAISNIIRSGKYEQIDSFIQTNKAEGMISMNKSIENLYRAGLISREVAESRTRDEDNQNVYY